MICYWLHILYLYIGSRVFWSKTDVCSNLTRTYRASIFDCESLRYMSNSRYLQYMDFIRFEKMFRSPLYENTFKKGMFGVLGSQKIIYKKPLKMGSKFTLTLVLEGWDSKWFYHKQIFSQKECVCAIGYTKAAFWKNQKPQDLPSIFKECGVTENERKVPFAIAHLFEYDYQLLKT